MAKHRKKRVENKKPLFVIFHANTIRRGGGPDQKEDDSIHLHPAAVTSKKRRAQWFVRREKRNKTPNQDCLFLEVKSLD